jgi:outer membrane protein insertion porin family
MNFGLPIGRYTRAGFGLRYQYTDFTPGYSILAQDFAAQYGNIFNDFLINATLGSDTRDKAILPTKGALQVLRAEASVPGSDLTYYKLGYEHTRYIPLYRSLVLSLSADLAYGGGYGETNSLPFFLNYYAGGPKTVRGFVANSLGPRDIYQDDPVGGNARVVGSVELLAPPPLEGDIAKSVRLGAFLDFGNVWVTDDTDLVTPTGFDLGELRWSAGLSATWISPIGALSVSYAFPLNEEEGDDTQAFQFTVGQTF